MSKCDKCDDDAVTFIRYSGAHLCERHLCEFVERRVKHEIRTQTDLRGGEMIAVAVSGGKDSMVALQLIVEILGDRRDIGICAVTVDEGIEGYRGSALPIVGRACDRIGVEHIVVSFEEIFDTTMDEIAQTDRNLSACSYCGVLRRNAMNRAARDWGATHLAT
ncbi:MAG: tRNA lysidine(34) synthetase TilS, partial [Thermoplasmata archaeon]|nr:tRNA lysidine(34) synthetase TilS [Thermoplasmata archaeon]